MRAFFFFLFGYFFFLLFEKKTPKIKCVHIFAGFVTCDHRSSIIPVQP
jgi:hypothetical protein